VHGLCFLIPQGMYSDTLIKIFFENNIIRILFFNPFFLIKLFSWGFLFFRGGRYLGGEGGKIRGLGR